jgi:hypothetical protein
LQHRLQRQRGKLIPKVIGASPEPDATEGSSDGGGKPVGALCGGSRPLNLELAVVLAIAGCSGIRVDGECSYFREIRSSYACRPGQFSTRSPTTSTFLKPSSLTTRFHSTISVA